MENPLASSVPAERTASPAPVAIISELQQQRLLSDLRALLPECVKEGQRITRIATSGVLLLLEEAPGSPWRGLTAHKLARLLGSVHVRPRAIRFPDGVFRGYVYDELRSAFVTRLPPCADPGLMRGPPV